MDVELIFNYVPCFLYPSEEIIIIDMIASLQFCFENTFEFNQVTLVMKSLCLQVLIFPFRENRIRRAAKPYLANALQGDAVSLNVKNILFMFR